MDSNEQVVCKKCFKDLPATWAGIDLCPWCLHLEGQKPIRQWRTPTYRTSLTSVDHNADGNE